MYPCWMGSQRLSHEPTHSVSVKTEIQSPFRCLLNIYKEPTMCQVCAGWYLCTGPLGIHLFTPIPTKASQSAVYIVGPLDG